MNRRSDSACNIHLLIHNVVPETFAGRLQLFVMNIRSKICHGRVKVRCTNRMPDRLCQLAHRLVVLCIVTILRIHAEDIEVSAFCLLFEIVRLRSSLVDKILRALQIPSFPGCMIQTKKRNLNFGMAGNSPFLSRFLSKLPSDTICHFLSDVQKIIFSCRFIIGNGCLNHMPHAIQLMSLLKIGPLLVRCLNLKISIQVSVFLLCLPDQFDHFGSFGPKPGIL